MSDKVGKHVVDSLLNVGEHVMDSVLGKKYHYKRVIGQTSNNMGNVYLCITHDGVYFVLKPVPKSEAKLAMEIGKHPNIISTYGTFIINGVSHIAMQYADGEDLLKFLCKGRLTSLEMRENIIFQILTIIPDDDCDPKIQKQIDAEDRNIIVGVAGACAGVLLLGLLL